MIKKYNDVSDISARRLFIFKSHLCVCVLMHMPVCVCVCMRATLYTEVRIS